jgi:hypothetical protein
MTHTANLPDVVRNALRAMGGKANIVQLARRLDLEAHGLAWELEHLEADEQIANVNGDWTLLDTVVDAVNAYSAGAPETSPATYTVTATTSAAGLFVQRVKRGSDMTPDDVVELVADVTGQSPERIAAYLLYRFNVGAETLRIPANTTVEGASACDITLDAVDLSMIRDDVTKIVVQHETVGSVKGTPRGHHGACDLEVFDLDGQQIALVVVYADGRVEALPGALAPAVD